MLTKLHKPFLKFVNDREGTSIVEFAVISPVMFTLLFGGFDFGHTLYMQSVLQGAINKAARDSALETGTVSEIQAAVDQNLIVAGAHQVLGTGHRARARTRDHQMRCRKPILHVGEERLHRRLDASVAIHGAHSLQAWQDL